MDTWSAYEMGLANQWHELMVFDWDKAAELIRDSKCTEAAAGLEGDWEWTGGAIYRNGKPVKDSYTYLASTWATPEIMIDGCRTPCYKMEHEVPEWNAHTKWPVSALEILGEKKDERNRDYNH